MVTAFDRDYRRMVRPRLVRFIEVRARFVADGIEGFEEASGRVMCFALNLGAGWLSPDVFADLEEWVLDELSERVGALVE